MMGIDDDMNFTFQCNCCGTCCKSDLEIFLNTLDVWNLRAAFREPTDALKEKYFTFDKRPEYGNFPFCILKMKKLGNCPFLEDHLCSIHHARPAACRFFPAVQYYAPDLSPVFALSPDIPDCGGRGNKKIYGLMSWLIVNKYVFYEEIIEFIPEVALALRRGVPDETVSELFDILYNFDTSESFPFRGVFPSDEKSAMQAVAWAMKAARKKLKIS